VESPESQVNIAEGGVLNWGSIVVFSGGRGEALLNKVRVRKKSFLLNYE
jgi:hypothetical protein